MKKLFAIVALGALVLNAAEAFAGSACATESPAAATQEETIAPIAADTEATSAESTEAAAQTESAQAESTTEAASEEIASTEAE